MASPDKESEVKVSESDLQGVSGRVQRLEEAVISFLNESKKTSEVSTAKMVQSVEETAGQTANEIRGLQPLFTKLYQYMESTNHNLLDNIHTHNHDLIDQFAKHKHEFHKIIESMSFPGTNTAATSKAAELRILEEMRTMKEALGAIQKVSSKEGTDRSSVLGAACKKMEEMMRGKLEKMETANRKISEMMNETINASQVNFAAAMSPIPAQHQRHAAAAANTDQAQQQTVKALRTVFDKMDKTENALNRRLDRMSQGISQSNASLLAKAMSESAVNHKATLGEHQNVLKGHLQQIQLRLGELNAADKHLASQLDVVHKHAQSTLQM